MCTAKKFYACLTDIKESHHSNAIWLFLNGTRPAQRYFQADLHLTWKTNTGNLSYGIAYGTLDDLVQSYQRRGRSFVPTRELGLLPAASKNNRWCPQAAWPLSSSIFSLCNYHSLNGSSSRRLLEATTHTFLARQFFKSKQSMRTHHQQLKPPNSIRLTLKWVSYLCLHSRGTFCFCFCRAASRDSSWNCLCCRSFFSFSSWLSSSWILWRTLVERPSFHSSTTQLILPNCSSWTHNRDHKGNPVLKGTALCTSKNDILTFLE